MNEEIDIRNPDPPWRWLPSWIRTDTLHKVSFVGSTDRFDVFYDETDNDYSLVHETDPDDEINFHLVEVDENGVVNIDRPHAVEGLDPLNMCQLYQLLEDSKKDKND